MSNGLHDFKKLRSFFFSELSIMRDNGSWLTNELGAGFDLGAELEPGAEPGVEDEYLVKPDLPSWVRKI